MNEILPGLWIGSYPFKENVPNLLRLGIKSILTLDLSPLPGNVFNCLKMKFIRLRDEPNQDILNILEDALEFIDTSLKNGGILIHWRCLFTSANLVSHSMPEKKTSTESVPEVENSDVSTVLIKGVTLSGTLTSCNQNEVFTEPLEWTRPYTHEVEGKVNHAFVAHGLLQPSTSTVVTWIKLDANRKKWKLSHPNVQLLQS